MSKIINVTLPEWVWLNGGEHEKGGDPIEGRNIVMHVRSASVIEFFLADDFVPGPNVATFSFKYNNIAGFEESHIAALHYCATHEDPDTIQEILERAAQWYCEYMKWEDNNLIADKIARQN